MKDNNVKHIENLESCTDVLTAMLKEGAQKKWIKLRGFDCLAKVINGVQFKDGIEVKLEDQVAA